MPPPHAFDNRDPIVWENAVNYLRSVLSEEEQALLRSTLGTDKEFTLHFGLGLRVRNLLRQGGFDGHGLGIPELDFVWTDLARAAIGIDPEATEQQLEP